jgi:hypothetical protein
MFSKAFYEGGLTIGQVQSLFELNQDREISRMKFFAKLQGVDIDKQLKEKEKESKVKFKDPKDYEKMSKEEREKLTQEMMQGHAARFSSGEN